MVGSFWVVRTKIKSCPNHRHVVYRNEKSGEYLDHIKKLEDLSLCIWNMFHIHSP